MKTSRRGFITSIIGGAAALPFVANVEAIPKAPEVATELPKYSFGWSGFRPSKDTIGVAVSDINKDNYGVILIQGVYPIRKFPDSIDMFMKVQALVDLKQGQLVRYNQVKTLVGKR